MNPESHLKFPSLEELVNPIDLDLFLMFENLEKARPNR
jgi:hypothetical protein